jgi:hypothetical protein
MHLDSRWQYHSYLTRSVVKAAVVKLGFPIVLGKVISLPPSTCLVQSITSAGGLRVAVSAVGGVSRASGARIESHLNDSPQLVRY